MTECQMDFPHEPIWCPSCWNAKLKFKEIQALEEAIRLKQTELNFRISGELDEVQPLPRPKPQVKFVAPTVPSKQKEQPKGGMRIESITEGNGQ